MAAKLYVVPASHPCAAVERALASSKDRLRPGRPAPGRPQGGQAEVRAGDGPGRLELDPGGRIVGSRLIMRALDAFEPEPPLLPADPVRRARVEDAERWGDEILQSAVRRLSWAILSRRSGTRDALVQRRAMTCRSRRISR